MSPKKRDRQTPPQQPQRIKLGKLLNPNHSLVQLAHVIDWSVFEEQFEPLYAQGIGRPGLSTRLLVGLHYLKHLYDVSDETVVYEFVENPYWQYFCGLGYFEHELPCHPTSLVKWRKRVGPAGVERLLQETLDAARRSKALSSKEIQRVNVDTTVQEKAIAFPTDARLYHKARRALVRAAKGAGLQLRQSYVRLSKRTLAQQSRYAHAKQWKRAAKQTKKLRTYLGRVVRDIQRKCPQPDETLQNLLEIAGRIYAQQRRDKGKIYSVHAPEVQCIAKGKAHQRYEFGCKVRVVSTSKNNWVVGIDAEVGNPYDGHTLKPALKQTQRLTGIKPKEAFVDKGFRGKQHHPREVAVYLSGRRRLSRTLKALLRRRSAIEPIISHLKHDHRMERNFLLGTDGDRINAMLTGCGFNLRKLLRAFQLFVLHWIIGFTRYQHALRSTILTSA